MPFEKILLVMPSGRHGLGYAFDVIPTGLEYLAAYIEDNVSQVDILDLKMEKKSIDYHLRRFKPDLVGISICATEHTEGLTIARKAKNLGMTTVVGNFHPTGLVNFFASHPDVDYVVRGEGEETLLKLIKKGDGLDIQGISYKNDNEVVHNPDRPLERSEETSTSITFITGSRVSDNPESPHLSYPHCPRYPRPSAWF